MAARVCKRSVEASSHSRIERIRSRGWCKGCRSLRGIIHAISPQAAQWARHLDNKQRRHNYSIPPLRVVVGVEFRSFAPLHPFPSLIQLEPRTQEVSFVGGTFQGASVGSSHASLTAFHPRSIEPWLPMTEFRENRVKGRGIVVSLVIFGNIRWMWRKWLKMFVWCVFKWSVVIEKMLLSDILTFFYVIYDIVL